MRQFTGLRDRKGNPCRSCRRLRSFDLDFQQARKEQDQKIAAFGSSYRGSCQVAGCNAVP
ncbi:hypothetical protein F6R97_27055 [Pseudomonas sp. JV414]|nr:hypothetical protein [Pseudomonas sp. JV414]